jgi:hypothetical protein
MTIFLNAFHSPLGAHASLTLGCRGGTGGFGVELGTPANENVYIGVETRGGGAFEALPFFTPPEHHGSSFYHESDKEKSRNALRQFAEKAVRRDFGLGVDTWQAGDLAFSIYSPVMPAPEPGHAPASVLKDAYCPCVLAELTVDNRSCAQERLAFFGYEGKGGSDSMRILDNLPARYQGIGQGRQVAIVTDSPLAIPGQGFCLNDLLLEPTPENLKFGLGGTAALLLRVPPKKKTVFRFAIALFRPGVVTSGADASYWYYRYFKTVESVARYGLETFSARKKMAVSCDRLIAGANLNRDQKFQLIHAIRSYYGSTQLLDWDGLPFWVVNEGEYPGGSHDSLSRARPCFRRYEREVPA